MVQLPHLPGGPTFAGIGTAGQDTRTSEGPSSKLCWYALQVLASHTLSAMLAEMVFTQKDFDFPGIYGAVEFGTFAAAPALAWACLRGPRAALRLALAAAGGSRGARFAACGVAMVVSHGAGLAAYTHVNYTTAMLFSSSRLPAVLFVGSIVQRRGGRRRPPCRAYAAALCTTLGLALFGIGEKRVAPRFSNTGLVLVAANLVLGAFTFNLQQRALQRAGSGKQTDTELPEAAPVTEQMMLVQYCVGAVLFIAIAASAGELDAFRAWCQRRDSSPWAALRPIVAGALLTAVGVRALLHVTAEFDAARASVITSTRKVCTFALSFVFFPKPLSVLHVAGVVLTVTGSVEVQQVLSRTQGSRSDRNARASMH